MSTLQLRNVVGSSEKHEGEVYSCTYSSDGMSVLSAGWDGFLRTWDATTGSTRTALQASGKPLSSCAITNDSRHWLSGSIEGLLCVWDGVAHVMEASFVAHTRPISSLTFSPNGKWLATASWDRQVTIREADNARESRTLGVHHDIVVGCRFTPDGEGLMSWSTDCTIKLWDVASGREMAMFASHTDRVTSVAISPDGTLAISGSRDSTIRLWDLEHFVELASVNIGSDVRVCFFLLDGESVVVADGLGRVFAMSLPTFEVRAQIQIPFHPLCGALAPTGLQIALGGEDGIVHFIDLEDQLRASFLVTALPCTRHEPTLLNKLFGGTRTTRKYRFMCPSCRREIESPVIPAVVTACPGCRRPLRVRSQPALTQ